MYADIKPLFFWQGMKKDVVDFVESSLDCHLVKDEHRHPGGLLRPHGILESKREVISMQFIVRFLINSRRHDSIFVVVDTLTKRAHLFQ